MLLSELYGRIGILLDKEGDYPIVIPEINGESEIDLDVVLVATECVNGIFKSYRIAKKGAYKPINLYL